jgi:hypothetical protein
VGRRLEWVAFVALCLAVAAAPLAAFVLLQELPANAWTESRWVRGVYGSWAVLIYFSWAFLPPIHAPVRERLQAWGWFLGLELAYPAVSSMMSGGSGANLGADLASYASTCVAGGAAAALLRGMGQGLREPYAWAWMPPALAIVLLLLLLPAGMIEAAWWQTAGLGIGQSAEAAVRVVGVGAGMAGVLRNLRQMQ